MQTRYATTTRYGSFLMSSTSEVTYSETKQISIDQLTNLYRKNGWSSADRPREVHMALTNSDALVSAWDGNTLVGIGNAISDGHLVVYYPHLLVLPEYQRRGIGKAIMERLKSKYKHFHQHMLVADRDAVPFYELCGFTRAGKTEPMWIYDGDDH